ncbi:MAG: apolipoprotein N-acyltransferase [Elusimicrobiota bacterium]|jgi:apolipoprotein N-acyltransferase
MLRAVEIPLRGISTASKRCPAAACAAAGALLALALPKPGLTVLAWFVPALMLAAAPEEPRPGRRLLLGWAYGAAFHAVVLHWIYLTCRFALVPVPVALLAWATLASILGLNAGLFALLARPAAAGLPGWARPWAWAALWAALESLSARWGGPRLGVDVLAYTQWRHLPLLQGSAWAGPHALSFLILLVNGCLLELLRRGPPARGTRGSAAAAGLLLALWWGYGAGSLSSRRVDAEGPRVEILQPNVDQYRKWDERFVSEIRSGIDALLSRSRTGKADLVLWPESALPGWLDEPENLSWVSGWAKRAGPMLVGSVTMLGGGPRNSAVLLDEGGKVAGIYHKRELVPFGEYVPLRRRLEPFVGILAQLGDFTAGPAVQPLLATRLGPLAASICYEAMFPRWPRGDAARGARVLANLTNDGWYRDTWGPPQHFGVNVFRAVENRALVLRAANTGVSGVIDPWGVTLARTELLRADRLDFRLPARDPFPGGSFYARHGDLFGALCGLLSAVLLLRAGNLRGRFPAGSKKK